MEASIYHRIVSQPLDIPQEYLHGVLHLGEGEVIRDVRVEDLSSSTTSRTVRFVVRIEDKTGCKISRRLFLKISRDSTQNSPYSELCMREVQFYQNIVGSARLSVVACHDARILPKDAGFVLLLDDVSSDYCSADKVDLADSASWFATARSLAAFHAHFWNLEAGNDLLLVLEDPPPLEDSIQALHEAYARFMDCAGERLGSDTMAVYERALLMSEELERTRYQRRAAYHNITVVHGDSHIRNFMFPTQTGGLPLMIDFQFWGVGLGVGDVAHLTRCSFPKRFRKTLHFDVLRAYHRALLEHDVSGYSWEACVSDYVSAVASMLFIPVWQYVAFHLQYDDWIEGVRSSVESFCAVQKAVDAS